MRSDRGRDHVEAVVDPDVIDLAVRAPRWPRAAAYRASTVAQRESERWAPHVAVAHNGRWKSAFAQGEIHGAELRHRAPQAVGRVDPCDRDHGVSDLDLNDDRAPLLHDITCSSREGDVRERSDRQPREHRQSADPRELGHRQVAGPSRVAVRHVADVVQGPAGALRELVDERTAPMRSPRLGQHEDVGVEREARGKGIVKDGRAYRRPNAG